MPQQLNLEEVKRVLEAVLLSSSGALNLAELKRVFEVELGSDFLRRALEELRADWQGRAVERRSSSATDPLPES